jgi:hypothetical protein
MEEICSSRRRNNGVLLAVYNKGHDNDAERFRQEQEPNVNNNGKETSNKTSDFPPLAGKTPGNDAAAAT